MAYCIHSLISCRGDSFISTLKRVLTAIALVQDLQLFDVVNIEERIVKHYDGIARLPQSFDEFRLVRRLFPCGAKTVAQVHQSCPCDILVVC